ncbi:MAG TPA: adenosylcobinamide-phosphate synthase CbiB, partial [Beijerinckiaceae bacterium]|nr:adenosylcobinamide-phosphate synthase CbiB [Beijerinckiaceae bacterium]
ASTLIAQRSLYAHVRDVAVALDRSLEDGRAAVALIVGRNVEELDEAGVSRAAVESLAENFSDGVVAPTFWLALAGLPGAALYKAINTADSMIGHKTERYRDFGYAAAKIDDVVNWPAARISGALIVGAAALGRATYPLRGWRVMKRDAGKHVSPNAGWPEAAMAGALHVRLGGPRAYGGNVVAGAWLGDADEPVDRATIRRALKLYRRACVLQFFGLAFVGALLV